MIDKNLKMITSELKAPIRVVQFGEGNFLRAFTGHLIQQLNESTNYNGSIAVIQPIEKGSIEILNSQDGTYTIFLEGLENGKPIRIKKEITCIGEAINPYRDFDSFLKLAKVPSIELIISNTTEAGIFFDENDQFEFQPANSFPGKLTQFLLERYSHFNGHRDKGVICLPCELINDNGDELKKCVLSLIKSWNLESDFYNWVNSHCKFHNTLVDRIVAGYPTQNLNYYKEQIDFEDKLMVVSEPFFQWIIESKNSLESTLPANPLDLHVEFKEDLSDYKLRKVRIINGIHTTMVPIGLLIGKLTVRECMNDTFLSGFLRQALTQEIGTTLKRRFISLKHQTKDHPLNPKVIDRYVRQVIDRFRNPYIEHRLEAISLNSISKFKVRVLPTILEYYNRMGLYPLHLVYGFACLLCFYGKKLGNRTYTLQDEPSHIKFIQNQWSSPTFDMVKSILSNKILWSQDLSKQPLLVEIVCYAIEKILEHGVKNGFYFFYRNQVA